MARIRSIKPELKRDAKLARVSRDARLTFVHCISEADDEGYLWAEPRQLLAEFFPYDTGVTERIVMRWVEELVTIGVLRWRVSRHGPRALEIVKFCQHQKIDRPTASRIRPDLVPLDGCAPHNGVLADGSSNTRRVLGEGSPLDQGSRTGEDQGSRDAGAAPAGAAGDQDPPGFAECWAAYPKRPGNSRADAIRAYRARLAAGADPAAMLAGVERYAAHIKAEGTPARYVKQAATFFGPGEHWAADWSAPSDGRPLVVDGWMSPELERETRPAGTMR